MRPDVGLSFLVLGHEDIKGDFWALLWLAPLIFLSWLSFRLLGLIILGSRSSPMTTSLPLVDST
jgi:hypothetical protein